MRGAAPGPGARAAGLQRASAAALVALTLSGCATYRLDVIRTPSYAVPSSAPATAFGRAFAPALADLAEHTLDVQYYIYEADAAGAVLADRLIAAARRGVRVRLLVDDNNLVRSEARFALLAGQPNLEIRVFNPYRNRVRWMRPLELLTSFGRVQRRMHNKIFAIDAELAVIGGRNIGNNYFELDRSTNFSDIEVLAAGPIAREAVESFDEYWNSSWAVPIEAFLRRAPTAAEAAEIAREVAVEAGKLRELRAGYETLLAEMRTRLASGGFDYWGEAELLVDPPEKIDESRKAPSPLLERAYGLWRTARKEVLVASAYLVPLRKGADLIAAQSRAGVRVRLLTNSLASTDVVPVHAGYAKRRRELLAAGVDLYEFQADARLHPGEHRYFRRMSTGASLHSKVMVVDRSLTWVGSFNIDPRSALINTELAVVVRSDSLAEATARVIEAELAPDRAWRLSLQPPNSLTGHLLWTGERNGQLVQLRGEPGATRWQRFVAATMRWIPGLDRLL